MNKFKDIIVGQDPVVKSMKDGSTDNPREDADLITKVLISNHGLDIDRFKKLPYERMLYCESLLCQVVQDLCDRLTKLSEIRMNSTVYMTHLESLKK